MDKEIYTYKDLIIAEMICIGELDWSCNKCPLFKDDDCSIYLNREIYKIMDEYRKDDV